MSDKLNQIYRERLMAAVGMAKFALLAGYKAGIGLDDKTENDIEWRTVLYIETPSGQVSWRVAPDDLDLVKGLPKYHGKWDGTFRSRDGSFLNWEYGYIEKLSYRESKVLKFLEARLINVHRENANYDYMHALHDIIKKLDPGSETTLAEPAPIRKDDNYLDYAKRQPAYLAGYRNYRGEWGLRNISPISARFGTSAYHKQEQLLIMAYDHDKQAIREFAAKDFCDDNRPCSMDLFVDALLDHGVDSMDLKDACKAWNEGCFGEALDYLPKTTQEKLRND